MVLTPTWSFVAETVEGEALGELTRARARQLTFDLRGPANVTFTLDGRDEQAGDLYELVTDLFVWRDREFVFRGRLGSTDDDLDADRHDTGWSAVDYRGVLGRRVVYDNAVYQAWDQADIAWSLVEGAQAYVGLPITRGEIRPAQAERWEVFEADTAVDTAISRFQDYADGYEWWIDPELRLQAATWRGVRRPDFPIAWGTTATRMKRAYDTARYANWVRVRGGRPDREEGVEEEPVEPYADRWSVEPQDLRAGRICRVAQNHDLKTQPAVDAAADQLLADSLNPPAAYTATLRPGLWQGPRELWLGDVVPIVIRSGRLDVATDGRVNQIAVTLDAEGNEDVEVTFGCA